MTRDGQEPRAGELQDKSPEEAIRLRRFFADVHAEDPTPAFDRLARPRPAADSRAWRPTVLRPAFAALTVLLLAAGVFWWAPSLRESNGGSDSKALSAALSEADQLALARELSSLETPLDFLLETPGREILHASPTFELMNLPPLAYPEETHLE